ncbi:hypothetical protein M427DRAFT_35268 [Gonapodya prolifera JEL478]|uniref:Uncharacterized protein n=1 Tax=Gonapodya prolifera (strain JEL478) TaxID=1344416 RepID=A0A139A5N5_GONPJ|nr:hypothetical protein M427DRAFT_35268 [Gonapodya prolifera JEL478]|eukprot:KXS11958.1 hypothetical protein M427DRAFT_35268 [Gonapodya prolifera JEL478]
MLENEDCPEGADSATKSRPPTPHTNRSGDLNQRTDALSGPNLGRRQRRKRSVAGAKTSLPPKENADVLPGSAVRRFRVRGAPRVKEKYASRFSGESRSFRAQRWDMNGVDAETVDFERDFISTGLDVLQKEQIDELVLKAAYLRELSFDFDYDAYYASHMDIFSEEEHAVPSSKCSNMSTDEEDELWGTSDTVKPSIHDSAGNLWGTTFIEESVQQAKAMWQPQKRKRGDGQTPENIDTATNLKGDANVQDGEDLVSHFGPEFVGKTPLKTFF